MLPYLIPDPATFWLHIIYVYYRAQTNTPTHRLCEGRLFRVLPQFLGIVVSHRISDTTRVLRRHRYYVTSSYLVGIMLFHRI